MKKMVNIGIVVLIGVGILAASLLLPKTLLGRQRQQAFTEKTAVPVEEVHPYGEEYIPLKTSLQKSIHTMAEYGQDKLDLHQWQEESDAENDVKSGYDKLEKFMKLWDEDYWSKVEEDENAFRVFYSVGDSNDLIFLPYVFSMNLTYECSLYYSPEYGIPVSGQVLMDRKALQEKSTVPAADQIWDGLLQAYVQSVGIPFQEEQQSTDMTDDLYTKIQQDVPTVFKNDNTEMKQYIYDSITTYTAQSVDDVFELTAVMYEISDDKIGVLFSLNSAN